MAETPTTKTVTVPADCLIVAYPVGHLEPFKGLAGRLCTVSASDVRASRSKDVDYLNVEGNRGSMVQCAAGDAPIDLRFGARNGKATAANKSGRAVIATVADRRRLFFADVQTLSTLGLDGDDWTSAMAEAIALHGLSDDPLTVNAAKMPTKRLLTFAADQLK